MTIERITSENYQDFCDMLYWRAKGKEEKAPLEDVPDELNDRNLYVYAAREESRFVGWISLTYLPGLLHKSTFVRITTGIPFP